MNLFDDEHRRLFFPATRIVNRHSPFGSQILAMPRFCGVYAEVHGPCTNAHCFRLQVVERSVGNAVRRYF
jgi:hypothetical protein